MSGRFAMRVPHGRPCARSGSRSLTELTQYSEQELLKLHGVGPKAIRLFREALAARGLAFASPGPSPGS
jgi:hypothetical protein